MPATLPRLDAIRGVSALMVFSCHACYAPNAATFTGAWNAALTRLTTQGPLGVNVFFVLSGFLITHLLLQEQEQTGRIHVRRFWWRRVLRIWPMYYLVVLLGFVVVPWVKQCAGLTPHEDMHSWQFLFFLSDLYKARGVEPDAVLLTVLWSVAVEEQFYLLWPLVLRALPRARYPWLFGAILVGAIIARLVMSSKDAMQWHPLSCMGDLATGALGAWLVRGERGRRWVAERPPVVIPLVLVFFALLYAMGPSIGFPGWHHVYRCLFAFASLGVILLAAFSPHRFVPFVHLSWLGKLGRISYGFYCLHMVGVLLAMQVLAYVGLDRLPWHAFVLQPLLALLVSVPLAALSYRYFERPFLRLKDRFAPPPPTLAHGSS